MKKFEFRFERMACDWEIILFSNQNISDLEHRLLDYIDVFIMQFSRFDPDSLVTQLNKKRSLHLNETFISLLQWSLWFHEKTEGLFNPLANPEHLGYRQSFYEETFDHPPSQNINLNLAELHIEETHIKLAPGQLLDFGGLGKGYLVDQLSSFLHAVSDHFFINAGGDIYAFGGKPDGSPWKIVIETPSQEKNQILSLKTGCIATSGTSKRQWANKHHILDPRSGDSAQTPLYSVTVSGAHCITADAIATALLIADKAQGQKILKNLNLQAWFTPSHI